MSGVVRMDRPTVHYRGCFWTGPIGRMVIFLAMISLLIPLFIGPGSRASASGGHEGTYFEYDYDQDISKCKGEYAGYDEKTRGTGRYEVIEWGPDSAKVRYSWRASYSNDDGEDRDYNRKGTLEFDLTDRRYLTSEFDLDDPEYRGIPAQEMAVWFYVPPNVEEGDRIHILDSEWRVTDTDKTLWSRWVPRKVIEVTHSSSSSRNDEYGVFDYHFTDRLYFDKGTGFFFAERYEEWDHGYYLGAHASFKLTIDLDVTSSSYNVQMNWLLFLSVYAGSALAVAGTLWSLYQLWKRFRWRKRERTIKGADPNSPSQPITVRIYRIRDILDLPQLKNNATTYFEPFLEHWTRKALLMGDPVVAAVSINSGLVGFGMYNREGSIGTILCRNTQLTEEIRSFLRCKDFFTETRHMIDVTNEMRESPVIMNLIALSRGETYNLFETNTVYRLPQLYPCKYDSDLVRPMKESDLREVAKLAKEIYKTPSKRWVKGSLKAGDIGFVAEISGRIVGFSFAEPCGRYGRVHTISVHKDFRSKGIAKELNFARLEALRQYGVSEAISEIGDWNLASIRVASIAGFVPIGKVYVETVRNKRVKKDIVRR